MAVNKTGRWRKVRIKQVAVRKLVDQFQAGNAAKGLSLATISWYERMLGAFLRGREELTLEDFTEENAIGFLGGLRVRIGPHGRPMSTQTIHGHYRALRAFSGWLQRQEFTEVDALAGLPAPKRQKKLIEPLSPEEVRALLGACDRQSDSGSRNYAILLLLLDTGLRASELLGLTIRDVRFAQGLVKVLGKGNKERTVPFGPTTQKVLFEYLEIWRPKSTDDHFFLSRTGTQMTWVGLHLMLRRLGEKSGVRRVHAHLVRHTFAVSWVEDDGDPFSLQKILGHSTLEMVRNYVNLASGQVIKAHRRHSPVDRLNLSGLQVIRGGSAGKRAS